MTATSAPPRAVRRRVDQRLCLFALLPSLCVALHSPAPLSVSPACASASAYVHTHTRDAENAYQAANQECETFCDPHLDVACNVDCSQQLPQLEQACHGASGDVYRLHTRVSLRNGADMLTDTYACIAKECSAQDVADIVNTTSLGVCASVLPLPNVACCSVSASVDDANEPGADVATIAGIVVAMLAAAALMYVGVLVYRRRQMAAAAAAAAPAASGAPDTGTSVKRGSLASMTAAARRSMRMLAPNGGVHTNGVSEGDALLRESRRPSSVLSSVLLGRRTSAVSQSQAAGSGTHSPQMHSPVIRKGSGGDSTSRLDSPLSPNSSLLRDFDGKRPSLSRKSSTHAHAFSHTHARVPDSPAGMEVELGPVSSPALGSAAPVSDANVALQTALLLHPISEAAVTSRDTDRSLHDSDRPSLPGDRDAAHARRASTRSAYGTRLRIYGGAHAPAASGPRAVPVDSVRAEYAPPAVAPDEI